MTKLPHLFSLALLVSSLAGKAANYPANKTLVSPIIDGIANEACWTSANWAPIDQLWLGAAVSASDFSGQYKVVWTASKLYLLVEITDDTLTDAYADPLSHWWDDDCVELFLDEDASGGDHQFNYNAFAYHVSTLYDVVDLGTDQKPHLFNDHITSKRTKTGNRYTWELEVNLYTDAFVYGAVSNPLATLYNKKTIGFSLAYCDNDGGTLRESFIGSKALAPADRDKGYITASVFGQIELTDANLTGMEDIKADHKISFFPNPAKNRIYFDTGSLKPEQLIIVNPLGQDVLTFRKNDLSGNFADISQLAPGIYFVRLESGSKVFSEKILVE